MGVLPSDWITYAVVALGLLFVLLLRWVGNGIALRLRRSRAHLTQARRHFVKSATFLNKARGDKLSASEARSFAGNAITEADLALELNPNDAATLIVKSLALKQLRKPAAALKVLNTALSKECSKTLSKEERADTLLQRAELTLEQMKGNRDNRIQDVFKDLQESVSLVPSNHQAHFMIAICCERTGDFADAVVAYQQALVVKPDFSKAQAALDRISKSCQDASVAAPV